MRKYYFILVFFISIFSLQAADLNLSPPIITGNFSICLPGITTTQLTVSGGSGIPDPTHPWVSSNLNVAMVDNNGLVTAVGLGTTTITYKDSNGEQKSENVYVSNYPTISTASDYSACAAGTLQLNGSLFPNPTTPWTSLNPSVATVDSTGLVTGVSAGTATIVYMNISGCTVSQLVTINPLLSPTVSCGTWANNAMTFNWNAVLGAGTYTVIYSINNGAYTFGASGSILTYTISNVAETDHVEIFVTPSGPVGYCYGGAFSCPSTPPCPEAGVLSGVQNICVGSTSSFTSTVAGGTWSSSDPNVATVNPTTGVVTGIMAGTATLTYTVLGTGGCLNATALRVVSVSVPASPGTLAGNQNICVGESTTFTSTAIGGVWSSANPTVATINSATGVIDGISSGNATITYTVIGTGGCSSATATRVITVNSCTSLTLTSDVSTLNQSVSPNSDSITPIVFNVSNGVTNVQVTGLPTGLSGQLNQGVFRITGTPTICGTFNWTATTVGGTGISSVSGTITVASVSTTLFCDSNNLPPNSVGFDWAPVLGATNYDISYSIDGGPTQTANSIASNYQVSGVLPGQSVLFTVASASGTPCFGPVSTTCTLLANSDFDADELSVYPNPVHDSLHIGNLNFTSDVSLFNAFGQQVYHLKQVSDKCIIPMSSLTDGFYVVKITSEKQTQTIKIVKN